MPCSKIRAQHLIELADDLAEEGSLATVAQFFAYLGPVFGSPGRRGATGWTTAP